MPRILSDSGYQPISGCTFHDIYNEENDQVACRIYGYKSSTPRSILFHLFGLCLLGIPYVVCNSYLRLKCWFIYTPSRIEDSNFFLVQGSNGNWAIEKVGTEKVDLPHSPMGSFVKYFFHEHTKYVWAAEKESFSTLNQLLWSHQTCDSILMNIDGLSKEGHSELLKLCGPNKIEVEIKSYWKLFIEEIFHPFYLFQAFSVALWCFDDYVLYAACVIVLTLFSSITSLIETRKQSKNLHDKVESSKCHDVTVLRTVLGRQISMPIEPETLVPGDLIVMPAANYIMPCDAVLITGQSIVNESVLTGESVPITKVSLHPSSEYYSGKAHKRHILYSGTHVLQTRYYGGKDVLARVVSTGFDTTKGHLVKSILFPTPVNLQFHKDSFKFIFFMFIISFFGMGYSLYLYSLRNASVAEIIFRSLDIITIVVPAALPAAMTIGTVYSQGRLKKLKIFCISPPRINVCGKIKLACFDKTGTLTHDGLIMNSVLPCDAAKFSEPVSDTSALNVHSKFVQGMASCHSLTTIDGKINGDPLDLNMFEFTKWNLEEPGVNENTRFDMLAPTIVTPKAEQISSNLDNRSGETFADESSYQIGIIREFSFSSTAQCMSVICKDLKKPNMFAFTKGAPEKLFNFCIPETIPTDFQSRLSFYTTRGFRVIALAYKELHIKFKWKDAQAAKRDMIEHDLEFLGLLILQNPLKSETVPVLRQLRNANIRTVMVTGDNIRTAISVARDCEMVDSTANIYILSVTEVNNINETPSIMMEKAGSGAQPDFTVVDLYDTNNFFAIDGKTWANLKLHYCHLIPSLLVRTTIFARFQPDQKTQLVTSFQDLDYIVSMVGDGANDCGALKAAHVGVSLSPAEASVAAPFTSGIPDISCIIWLILEGRCSLVTSFSIFKYMALYSMIQFVSILILYTCHSMLGNFQFLFIDLIITTTLAVTMGRQGPSKILHSKRPMSSLVSAKNLVPLCLQILTITAFQVGALYYLYQQNWFQPIPSDVSGEIILSWENTVLFTVSCFQYVILAWHFTKGKPYRMNVFTNFWFLINVLCLMVIVTWLALYPCTKIAEIMELIDLAEDGFHHMNFRYFLMLFPIGQFIVAGAIELKTATIFLYFTVTGVLEICCFFAFATYNSYVCNLLYAVFLTLFDLMTFMHERTWLKRFFQCILCKKQPKNKYKRLLQEQNFEEYLASLQELSNNLR